MGIAELLPGFLVSLAAGATVYGLEKLIGKDPMREMAKRLSLPQPAYTPGDFVEELGNPLPCPPDEGPPLPIGLVRKLELGWEIPRPELQR